MNDLVVDGDACMAREASIALEGTLGPVMLDPFADQAIYLARGNSRLDGLGRPSQDRHGYLARPSHRVDFRRRLRNRLGHLDTGRREGAPGMFAKNRN